MPNAIDLPPLTPKADRPTLCFLGRLNARSKRLDHAVAIFERVRADLPQAELWVIGRGAPPPGLLDRVGVRRFSNVSSIERDRLLGAAWVCLATSVREGWGRMVLEAAAAGTPSVVYDAPGLREAVAAGVTREVVPVDVGRAAQCVARILRDPPRVRSLGDQARARAAGLDWGGSVARFEEVLEIVRSGDGWSDRKMPINEEVMAS